MIKVIYDREHNKVTMEGHAHSGEKGHDLVCASASILAYTLASFVENTYEADHSESFVTKLNEGDAEVSCKAKQTYKGAITLVFDAICGGFEILALNYPDNISYEMKI